MTHQRSLDDIATDCLRFFRVANMDPTGAVAAMVRWQLRRACVQVAEAQGWTYVKSHDWWPEAEAIVFASSVQEVTV